MASDAVATRPIPQLDSGARLTRMEFERRYEASPPWIKAELIEGVVYVAAPVSLPHGDEHFRLIACQSIDLHEKLAAYRRNGVQEYIVWRVYDRALDWFALHQGDHDSRSS